MVTIGSAVYRAKRRVEEMKLACLPPSTNALKIVTGADFTHFQSLLQLLKSIQLVESRIQVSVYDLGLTYEQRRQLESSCKEIRLCTFDYGDHPAHFNIRNAAGHYAWKPVIIKKELSRTGDFLLWLDAGCVVEKPLTRIRQILRWHGFYSPISQGTIKDWTHPAMIVRFGVDSQMVLKRNLSSGVVGMNPDNELVRRLVDEWEQCALKSDCIAPEGSDRSNHRQDQSALTILAWKLGLANRSPKFLHGLSIHCDID